MYKSFIVYIHTVRYVTLIEYMLKIILFITCTHLAVLRVLKTNQDHFKPYILESMEVCKVSLEFGLVARE